MSQFVGGTTRGEGAQVGLRVSRQQVERSRYPGPAWHVVPVLLLCGMVVLQGMFALLGGMAGLVRTVGWLGTAGSSPKLRSERSQE